MGLTIRSLEHLVLRVRDLEGMVAFYRDVIGLSVERRQDGIGLVQLRAGTQLVDLVAVDSLLGRTGGVGPGAQGRNLDHFCLNVEDFDLAAVTVHLASHGVAVGDSGQRDGAGGQGLSVYLSDPEGNGLELRG